MLENTIYRLNKEKKISIGYFGGSITEGCGASSPLTSWVGLTSGWFKENFPETDFAFTNASIGGTGSMFGVYRLAGDLLDRADPDLIFVEFAVNDFGWPYEGILADMESIIRQIRTRKPTADIIFIYTATLYTTQVVIKGEEFGSRAAHSALAHYYGAIPSVDIGEVLRNSVNLLAGGDWMRYTQDNVHPNDEGYAICAEAIAESLSGLLLNKDIPGSLTPCEPLPAMLSKIDRTAARMVDPAEAVRSDGWEIVNEPLCGRGTHYIMSDKPGSVIELHFTGYRAGIYMALCHDGGYFSCQLDDGPEEKGGSFTQYDRISMCATPKEVEYGEHIYRIRILDGAPEGSAGTVLKFLAFIVS